MNIRDRIISHYNGVNSFGASTLKDEYSYKIFKYIMADMRFNHILEIGTYHGASTCLLSEYAEKVTTIDINPKETKIWEDLGINNIKSILAENDEDKAKIILNLDFDFAFIDGDHKLGVFLDWFLVKRCKHVLFHDYSDWPFHRYVREMVDFLPEEETLKIKPYAYWECKK
jgi:hypothetical protein